MFIVTNYATAVFFCIITMLAWGSWANTQKLAGKKWHFELFYWDYVIGMFLFSILAAFTLGSFGEYGRSFTADLAQAGKDNLLSAFIGGVIFNLANILFAAAIAITGMAVAFPVSIGLALVLGVIINYMEAPRQENAVLLFIGVGLVAFAILLNAAAYRKARSAQHGLTLKGVGIALAAGLLMSFFYRFVAASMDLTDMASPAPHKLTPYTATFIFSVGALASNFLFNTVLMKRPLTGDPLSYRDYFKGASRLHLVGLLGGMIWGLGNCFNLIAAGKAGPAISYGLGQGATLIAALWGVFVWGEFKDAPKGTGRLITAMFLFFLLGLGCVVYAGM